MKKKFLLCGSLGWCLEVFWTGLHALFSGDPFLTGKTSLWMFPIYGCAVFIGLVYRKIFYRIFLWYSFKTFSDLSMGLQQKSLSFPGSDSSGLCTSLVFYRSAVRKNTSKISLKKQGTYYMMKTRGWHF